MAKKQYSLYAHTLHSMLQMVRNRMSAQHDMTPQDLIKKNSEWFDRATNAIRTNDGVEITKYIWDQAAELFLASVEPGHPIQSKDYSAQLRLITQGVKSRLKRQEGHYEVSSYRIGGLHGAAPLYYIQIRQRYDDSVAPPYAVTPGFLASQLQYTDEMIDWVIVELSKQRPVLFT